MFALEALYNVIIMPLKLFFELLYMLVNKNLNNPGLSIVFLSLAMNFLVLPLYMRADEMQEEEKNIELKLSKGVAHIKKTFKGDEKMMMLQTYYRQNNYKPTYVFRSSISLFLEIPFFIAAYQFLSSLDLLNGVSFGVLTDLGKPDGMLKIGSLTINIMPFVMTGINLISCAIFTKGYPMKQKLKLYAMALFFLVFLYTSPSGLVFYWTLNNLFSLVKTLCYKIKLPKREKKPARFAPDKKLFLATIFYLAVLVGGLIPSSVIAASPLEFVEIQGFDDPLWHIVVTATIAVGIFWVWINVFYRLCSDRNKHIFETVMLCLMAVMTVNYMLFNMNLGNLSTSFQYELGVAFLPKEINKNWLVMAAVVVITCILCRFVRKYLSSIIFVLCIAVFIMSARNGIKVEQGYRYAKSLRVEEGTDHFTLSKTGKNVVVIMLDRAVGEYIPYFFNERPELKEKYSGFTYYSNVVSFSGFTIGGAPALFGGYEYTPIEYNKQSDRPNKDKHNEAVKVLPVLFANNGFDVTVHEIPYINYSNLCDYSLYDGYGINYLTDTHVIEGSVIETGARKSYDRNFFCYSLMKTLPLYCQKEIYDNGNYYNTKTVESTISQHITSDNTAIGVWSTAMKAYLELANLDKYTQITNENENTFYVCANDVTHEVMYYQAPNYEMQMRVDNTKYDIADSPYLTLGGKTLNVTKQFQRKHYYSNYAAILRLAEWFDYLKKNGVYDNTRIIIASDHGRYIYGDESLDLGDGYASTADGEGLNEIAPNGYLDVETYYPLLMVKDFGSTEFTESTEFMTNADVPTLCVQGLIDNPVNPFTGKLINNDEKFAHDQIIMGVQDWDSSLNDGTFFKASSWFSVHTDMRDLNNWTILDNFDGFVQ